jgi:hypothetical protein
MGRMGVGRMRRMGIACMGSGGGHRKNAEDGMGRMGRMGIACLGIVAVDTAKTLKMEWEGSMPFCVHIPRGEFERPSSVRMAN